ncbi:MAG: MFS transporter [Trebonia sp.]|jgi:predicted MFS family arabinose efflux permease
MSRPQQAAVSPAHDHSLSYRGLLALPGARAAFAAAAVARVSFGMASLSLLLLIHQSTGSFAAAGAATGAFSAGTLTAPAKARLMDRRGHAVLPVLGLGAAVAMLTIAALAQASYRNPVPYIFLCGVAGTLMPPVGPAMRALWAARTGGGENLRRAYSLDAAAEETLFTAGPLLMGLMVTVAGVIVPLLVTAALLAAGALLLGASGAPAPAARPRPHGLAGPLAVPGFRVLLGIVLATSVGLGTIDVTITARAVAGHHPGAAGCVFAAVSLGSAAGGLGWGKLRHRSRPSTQMAGLLAAMAAGTALAAVTPGLLLTGTVLALTGTVLAPSAVLSYLSAERLVGPGAEASTWVNTAWNGGVAAGLALAGLAVGRAGTVTPMLAGAVVLAGAASAALLRRPAFDGVGPDEVIAPR